MVVGGGRVITRQSSITQMVLRRLLAKLQKPSTIFPTKTVRELALRIREADKDLDS
jgi:hypothetical protein